MREFLESDVLPATEGRVRFHARVAANVLRHGGAGSSCSGPNRPLRTRPAWSDSGCTATPSSPASIRSGALDSRADEVRAVVRATVADKLAVANPAYLDERAAEVGPGSTG